MKIIISERQLKIIKESNIGKSGRIGSFDIPSFNKLSDMISFMSGNRQKFIGALSEVTEKAESKFNSMESIFRLVDEGSLKFGDKLDNIPIEQYITRQGGLRDEFVKLMKDKQLNKSPQLNKGKIISNDDIPIEELRNIKQKFGELIKGWKYFGTNPSRMSGWKFHVYGEDIYDSLKLYETLNPVVNKWGAYAKVGVEQNFRPLEEYLNMGYPFEKASELSKQFGKKGASIYIPPEVFKNNRQEEFLNDIEQALQDAQYSKKGTISGDKSITDNITYRYELSSYVDPTKGIDSDTYGRLYMGNEVGAKYKPDDVMDVFGDIEKQTNKLQIKSGDLVSNNSFVDEQIDWSQIRGFNNMNDYNKEIAKALRNGDYSKISSGGFENYGIDDLKNFLRYKMDLEANQFVNTSNGTWGFKVK